jgi:hypothetical protein
MSKSLFSFIFFFLAIVSCRAQDSRHSRKEPVKLISSHAGQCDNRVSPDYLVTRITDISIKNNQLYLTVNFKDNCCAQFNPGIKFSNDTLYIRKYIPPDSIPKGHPHALCGCDCCFSIDFVISNIKDTSFITLFDNKRIVYSLEPYPVFPIKFEILNGDTINKNNKYGGPVGLWINYYDNKQIKDIAMYPVNNLYLDWDSQSIWYKGYYENGQMRNYVRTDSTDAWYESGKIRLRMYKTHEDGDEIVYTEKYFDNGQLKEKTIERNYGKEHQIEDTLTQMTPLSKTELHESYYSNGQREFLMGKDTSKEWYEDGKFKRWYAADSSTEFYENGAVKIQEKRWKTENPFGWRKLDNSLHYEYYQNGIRSVEVFMRDEANEEGIAGNIRYEWKWDEKGNLISQPKVWDGPIPR